jgi:hypothetical protein
MRDCGAGIGIVERACMRRRSRPILLFAYLGLALVLAIVSAAISGGRERWLVVAIVAIAFAIELGLSTRRSG